MKANAPEKIWINSLQDLPCSNVDSNSIEYVRTDVFIEKAIKWISNNCYIPHATLEDFRKYMEGE